MGLIQLLALEMQIFMETLVFYLITLVGKFENLCCLMV